MQLQKRITLIYFNEWVASFSIWQGYISTRVTSNCFARRFYASDYKWNYSWILFIDFYIDCSLTQNQTKIPGHSILYIHHEIVIFLVNTFLYLERPHNPEKVRGIEKQCPLISHSGRKPKLHYCLCIDNKKPQTQNTQLVVLSRQKRLFRNSEYYSF